MAYKDETKKIKYEYEKMKNTKKIVEKEEVVDAVGGSACVRDRDRDREVR